MYSIETVEDIEGFHALRSEWNELLRDSDSNCPFLTWEWLYTWWELLAEDRKLHILLLRDGQRLMAIAPLAFRPWRWKRLLPFRALEFLGGGYVGSDYLNFIIRKGHERSAMGALIADLEKTGLMLELSQLNETAPLTKQVMEDMARKDFLVTSTPVDVCLYIDLRSRGFDDYLGSLGSSHRANYRRRLRNLSKDFSMEFERAWDEDGRREALQALIDLHLERWRSRGGSNALNTSILQQFHERFTRLALEKGWLRLYVLRLDGRIAAALYCLFYDGTYYYYQLGFDPLLSQYSPGLCAVGLCIQESIAEGVEEFDFLRGDEQYKHLWADRKRNLIRLEIYPPYLKGKFVRGAMGARQDLLRHTRGVIPQARNLSQLLRPPAASSIPGLFTPARRTRR